MVIVHKPYLPKYYDKQRRVEMIKYSNGVMTTFDGDPFYLPRRLYNGEGIFGDIVNFISKNKDTISNVASAASSVVDNVGKICNTILDTIKKIKELKTQTTDNG